MYMHSSRWPLPHLKACKVGYSKSHTLFPLTVVIKPLSFLHFVNLAIPKTFQNRSTVFIRNTISIMPEKKYRNIVEQSLNLKQHY